MLWSTGTGTVYIFLPPPPSPLFEKIIFSPYTVSKTSSYLYVRYMYYSIDPPRHGSAGPILEGLLNRIFSFGVPASVSNHCTVYSTYLLYSPLAPESFLRRRPCTRIYADKGQVFAMGRAKMLVFNPFTNFFVIFAKIYRWQNTIICYWRIRTDTSTVRKFRENDFVHTLVGQIEPVFPKNSGSSSIFADCI